MAQQIFASLSTDRPRMQYPHSIREGDQGLRTAVLTEADRDQVLAFLSYRPVHTVAMTSFIRDNGLVSQLNRGTYYGCYSRSGELEGVALIGHTTLVEARSAAARKALARIARETSAKMHIIMSDSDNAIEFHAEARPGAFPRTVLEEYLFEIGFPFLIRGCKYDVRTADASLLDQIANAQAEVAFLETGDDPMLRDPEGFKARALRRIEQGRVFVVVRDGTLIFKADVVSLTDEVAYLEGIWVNEADRGEGIGPDCLAEVSRQLLGTVQTVCLLSNCGFTAAHRSFEKAGFRKTGQCTTIFA